jgi:hypothetical protein
MNALAPARLMVVLAAIASALSLARAEEPGVARPPESFLSIVLERDRDAARKL